jgi:hypothetical protein
MVIGRAANKRARHVSREMSCAWPVAKSIAALAAQVAEAQATR